MMTNAARVMRALLGIVLVFSSIEATARVEPVVDDVLTAEDYVRAGVPGPTGRWSEQEMAAAEKALTKIAERDVRELPRLRGERSGAVFDRITAPENLAPFRDRSTPVAQRGAAALAFMQSSNNILKLYVTAAASGDPRPGEIVELLGLMLRILPLQLDLIKESLPTFDEEDPSYLTRLSGLDDFRRNSAGMVVSCVQTLADSASFSADERRRLIALMDETVPALFAEWQPALRTPVLAVFEQAALAPGVAQLQPAFAELHVKVRTAAAAPVAELPGVGTTSAAKSLEKLGVKVNRSGAGKPDESGWTLAHSDAGRFSVSLPGLFNDWSTSEEGVTSHGLGMTTLEGVKFVALSIARADGKFPPAAGLVETFRSAGAQVETRVVKMSGKPGLEIVVAGPTANAALRRVEAGGVQYLLTVDYHPALKAALAEHIARFFDSFAIEGPPGGPGGTAIGAGVKIGKGVLIESKPAAGSR